MKQFVTAGTLAVALAVGGTALAQQPPPPPAKTPAAAKPADQAEKPAPKPRAKHRAAGAADKEAAAHTAPKQQPGTAPEASAPDGAMALGTVRIPKAVKADGKDLPAGTYQVRLTPEEAKPDAKGSTEKLERWVEFVKGGKVVGREVVSIVPATEANLVQKDTPPRAGGSKVETLKGGDYTRVWINKGGNYYLLHLANG
ncbi:MAG TPA: hypothetical protein VNC21_10275 [Vicinamibacterales bacterium]|nr:hypothetical protein [Vicinamibacterales bacterium]